MNIKIAGIFNIIALLLLVAGALAPGWVVFEQSSGKAVHIGLFYAVKNGYSSSLAFVGFIEFQIEVIIGIILCIIATILIFVYANGQKAHSYLMAPVILNLIAGIVTWVAVGRFLQAVLILDHGYDMGVPYSLILSGLGGVMLFVIMVVLIVKKTQDSNQIQTPQRIVMADTSKPQVNMGYSQDTP
ncbi:uncharacterized protein LOC127724542 [Mytilus californianus]|uniref:uncharacterized protein LOC127724542 n=1 Tax=Mytilus californianus TaxID=6549 RepID=UPI002246C7FC|nr:uncharacterized protein LOC127724542 [Mytilus californianus]